MLMKLYRRRYRQNGRYHTYFQLRATPEEVQFLQAARLWNIKVHMHAGSLMGSRLILPDILSAFQAQVNRIRNRWSVALARTTGSVFFDFLIVLLKVYGELFKLIWRVFFGTRKRVSTLVKGFTLSSGRAEDMQEQEIFVLTTAAAVMKAAQYARDSNREDEFDEAGLMQQVPGLTFAALLAGQAGADPVEGALKAANEGAAAYLEDAEDEFDMDSGDADLDILEPEEPV
jgi:hypothetical protein